MRHHLQRVADFKFDTVSDLRIESVRKLSLSYVPEKERADSATRCGLRGKPNRQRVAEESLGGT